MHDTLTYPPFTIVRLTERETLRVSASDDGVFGVRSRRPREVGSVQRSADGVGAAPTRGWAAGARKRGSDGRGGCLRFRGGLGRRLTRESGRVRRGACAETVPDAGPAATAPLERSPAPAGGRNSADCGHCLVFFFLVMVDWVFFVVVCWVLSFLQDFGLENFWIYWEKNRFLK